MNHNIDENGAIFRDNNDNGGEKTVG